MHWHVAGCSGVKVVANRGNSAEINRGKPRIVERSEARALGRRILRAFNRARSLAAHSRTLLSRCKVHRLRFIVRRFVFAARKVTHGWIFRISTRGLRDSTIGARELERSFPIDKRGDLFDNLPELTR